MSESSTFEPFGPFWSSPCLWMSKDEKKAQVGQEFPAFSQVQCKNESMGAALLLLDEERDSLDEFIIITMSFSDTLLLPK